MGDISIKGKSPILRQGYKKGGTVKKNKPKSKKSSTLRGVGIARKGVRKAKIR